jgi:hypothetical protein
MNRAAMPVGVGKALEEFTRHVGRVTHPKGAIEENRSISLRNLRSDHMNVVALLLLDAAGFRHLSFPPIKFPLESVKPSASILMRRVAFVTVPTTVISQPDAVAEDAAEDRV